MNQTVRPKPNKKLNIVQKEVRDIGYRYSAFKG